MKKSSFDFLFAPRGKMPDFVAPQFAEYHTLPQSAVDNAFGANSNAPAEEELLADPPVDDHVCGPDCGCGHDHDHSNGGYFWDQEGIWNEPADDPIFGDVSDVKPAHAGGGGGGGKGNGKGKDKVVEEPTDTGGTDGGTTGGTDGGTTGGTDGGTTGGTTGGGSTEFGWTSDTTYVSGGDTPDGFNVELVFNGSWTDDQMLAICTAAETLSDLVTGDIPEFNGIDDIRIQCYTADLGGSGGTLANGGWIKLRGDEDRLVAEGGIRIDTNDIDRLLEQGKLAETAFHEMLHAMGFGQTWGYTGLEAQTDGGLRFVGENAIEAYNTYYSDVASGDPYSDQGVPLAGDTAHWSYKHLGDDVMSPYMTSGSHIGLITIAALEDMGYETIYGDPEQDEVMGALVV